LSSFVILNNLGATTFLNKKSEKKAGFAENLTTLRLGALFLSELSLNLANLTSVVYAKTGAETTWNLTYTYINRLRKASFLFKDFYFFFNRQFLLEFINNDP